MPKTVDELTFTDDGMFQAVMHDPTICAELVERLLHIRVKQINYPKLEKQIAPYSCIEDGKVKLHDNSFKVIYNASAYVKEKFRRDYAAMNLHDRDLIRIAKKEASLEKSVETARKLLADGKYTAEEISALLQIPAETFMNTAQILNNNKNFPYR